MKSKIISLSEVFEVQSGDSLAKVLPEVLNAGPYQWISVGNPKGEAFYQEILDSQSLIKKTPVETPYGKSNRIDNVDEMEILYKSIFEKYKTPTP